jgi:two-component system sensor histidine kinase DesK
MVGHDESDFCAADGRRPSLTLTAFGGRWSLWNSPRGTAARWFFSVIWLVYLVQPVFELFGRRHHGAVWMAGGVVLAVTFCAVYILVLGRWENQPAQARLGLAAIVLLAIVSCVVYGHEWTSLWIYVSAATGFVMSGRRAAMLAVVGVGGCFALTAWLAHEAPSTFFVVLLPVVLTGWAMIGFRIQITLMKELRQARETVARLAANEERLRLARDMHDLTGQSLSLITLKSELAAKRLARMPQSAELDTIRGEITDIGRVSRQTLHDIREAVSGYRRPTLAVELITARTSLEAAGIRLDDDPDLTMRSGTFDPDAEAALAWCLREAATNVIRHSGAVNCRIRLSERSGEFSLEVSDDGRGLSPSPTDGSGPPGGPGASRLGVIRTLGTIPDAGPGAGPLAPGAGLHGMSERLSAVGGHLEVLPSGQGFRLTATVPADIGSRDHADSAGRRAANLTQ